MIPATETDRPALEAFLTDHIATSMFPLSNLRKHGMQGGHPRAVNCWVNWKAGQVTDVLTISEEGFVFPQCPNHPWSTVRAILDGRPIQGIIGDAVQVAGLQRALGWRDPAAVSKVEPLYHLHLSDLRLPDCSEFTLRDLSTAPIETVLQWREAYLNEVLKVPGEDTAAKARHEIEGYLQAGTHRVLFQGDTAVAMTGFNAQVPGVVQVGGVYTPPELRGRGLARRAVGLHLQEAGEAGVQEAILFAASTNAARAYEAIGFRQIGEFAIVINEHPQVVHV
ncbi:GNAT family N-acetyltransferase [Loktanella sp. S4079]|uniref:GNAT family N-acetyltransferase n=1 Tax=Loktanella sp. S4079 TaxID=579483 RepID=UPI0005F9D18F|nr:GNAT family N-acetyltransferase [Loktanella sp. S4079]KJZ18030.1 GNAT family acetyltransferase [Loktanella sp. S4079]